MTEYNPPSIEACLDKPADVALGLERPVTALVSSKAMVYWHERAMRAETMLIKLVDALEHKTELRPAFVEARDLIARGFTPSGEVKP